MATQGIDGDKPLIYERMEREDGECCEWRSSRECKG